MQPFFRRNTNYKLLSGRFCSIIIVITLLILSSCKNQHNRAGVEAAMKQYDHLIKKLDADSISLLYTANGNLGDIVHGRDSIKKFLSSFLNVRVLSQVSSTKSIDMYGDSATQKGSYQQMDLIAEKDTVRVNGEYTAHWEWIPSDGWHIKYMVTKPIH